MKCGSNHYRRHEGRVLSQEELSLGLALILALRIVGLCGIFLAGQPNQSSAAPDNNPPTAVDDAYSLDEDSGKSVVAAGGVLANDSDLDGDPMAATLVADVSHGSLIFSSDGSFSYSPNFDFAGTDSFHYQVTNTFGTSLVATVTLTVNPVNDSPFLFASGSQAIAGRAASLTGFLGIDWDAGTNHVGITFDVPGAVLLAEPVDGMTVTTNSGNSGTLTLSGPLDDLNLFVALGSLQVIVPAGEATNRPVQVTIDDYGNTGADPGLTGTTTNEVASVTSELKVRPGVLHLSVPTNGIYRIGDHLDFVIHVSEPVTVTTNGGIPYFDLYLWNALRAVSYVSSEYDTNWLFRYTVVSDDYVIGPYLGGRVETNGATVADADGEAFIGTFPGSQTLTGVTVDGIVPGISQVNPPSDQWYKMGATVAFTVTMDEVVLVGTNAGIPRFTVTLDNTNAFANYVSGSGTGELTFEYVVRPGDTGTNGITIEDTLDLNGGTIRDTAGNPIVETTGTAISLPGVLIDGIPPAFAYASFDLPSSGVLIEGDTLHWFLWADEEVTVDSLNGSPTLELALDSGTVTAMYVSNSSPRILQFDLPILAGYLDTNGFLRAEELVLNGAVIQDAAGNEASVQTPAPYEVNGAIIDAVRPVFTQVTPPDPGIYGAGATLDFLAEFTEPVAYNGQSPITLVIGITARTPVYVDGSGSNVLRFRYTVQSGDADADGVEIQSAGFSAEDSVLDLVSNRVDLSVYSGTVAGPVRVKTTYPVAGDDTFTLNEDELFGSTVAVNDYDPDGLPLTTILVGDATNGMLNLSGDGTFLYLPFTNHTGADVFTYAVTDSIFTSAVATVTLTIDPINDPPRLTLGSIFTVTGGVARAVTDITIADTDADTNAVHFSLTAANFGDILAATSGGGVTVSNNSSLEIHLWGAISNLNTFIAGAGIQYTPASDLDPQRPLIVRVQDNGNTGTDPGLDSDPASESTQGAIYIDRATANDPPTLVQPFFWQSSAYGTPFEYQFSAITFLDPDADMLRFEAFGLPPGITLSTSTRTFSGTPTTAGDYTVLLVAGDQQSPELFATNTFTFSVGKTVLTVTVDNQTRAYGTTNAPFAIHYSGFITPDDENVLDAPPTATTTADMTSIPGTYAIDFTGGSDGNYDFSYLPGTLTVTNVDSGDPVVLGVLVPDAGLYHSGDILSFVVQTSEPVNVTAGGSNAVLMLQLDNTNRWATYASGSGTTELLFLYTIASGDSATNLILGSSLETNTTSIADIDGHLLDPTLQNIGSTEGITIDGSAPQILSRTPPTNGWYKLGATIEFTITMDEIVIVDTNSGIPRFSISLDETNTYANYTSGSGSNVLTFRHIVQAGELGTNGITLHDTLHLNGGSLTDLAGNDIFLNFVPDDILPNVKVDGVKPFFFYSVTHFPEFVYREGEMLFHYLYAREPISVDLTGGTPSFTIQLDSGPSHFLYVSNLSPTQLTFRLIIEAGDESTNGFAIGESLDLNGAVIRDDAGNEMDQLDLPAPHEARGFAIDARRPLLTNAVPPAPGIYEAGESLDFLAQFSEPVIYVGPPPFTFQIGNSSRTVTFVDGNESNVLRFRYTVQAGDFAPDGVDLQSNTNAESGVLDLAVNFLDVSVSWATNFATVRIDASRPVAVTDLFSVGEDSSLTTSVVTNDVDADHNGLTVTATSSVTNGSLSISPSGLITYTPATNFSGLDGFTYMVSDGLLVSTSGSVRITVIGTNDPPTLSVPATLSVTGGVARIVSGISIADVDAGSSPVHLILLAANAGSTLAATSGGGVSVSNNTALSLHLWGTVSNLNDFLALGNISLTPAAGPGPLDALQVRLEDNGNSGDDPGLDSDPTGESAGALIVLEQPLQNDRPVVTNPFEPSSGIYGQPFSTTFPTNTFIDPEGDTLRYLATNLPPGITFTSATRTFSGTPAAAGTYSFQLIAGDQQSPELFATNTVNLTIAKFTLAATADSKSKAVGSPNPPLTVSVEGFVGGDTVADIDVLPTASTAATLVSPPGVYAIDVTGGSDNNYDFVYIAAPLTVTNGVGNGTGGVFSGLFYETNEVRHASSGAIQVKTTDAGKFSGTLELAGKKLKFSGTFDSERRATNVIVRKGAGPITIEMIQDAYTPPQLLLGTVTDGSWSSELFAARASFHARTNPAPMAGRYTIVLPGADSGEASGHGHGYGVVTVATSGKLSLAGALADGSKFSDGTIVNGGALWPLYVPLYKAQGSSIGWLLFSNAPAANPGGLVSWIRPSSFGGAIHGTGITNETTAVGSLYTPPLTGQTALSWTNGTIAASGGNLVSALTNNLFFSTANKVTLFGTNFSKVSLTAKTGKFKGSFKHPVTGRGITFNGVLLQDLDLGAGFFLGTNQSGRISIEPSP